MGSGGKGLLKVFALWVALMALILVGASIATAGTSGRFVRAATGEVGGVRWSVRMARVHGERCFSLLTLRGKWGGEGTVCGGASFLHRPWSRILGDAGADGEPSVELDLAKPRVRTLNVLLGHPVSGNPASWHEFPTHVLNVRQARISHMPRDFRFAVITELESACVEAVEGLDRWGHVVVDEEIPCEF